MLGKFAAVIGPVLMGWVGLVSGNPRYALLSVCLLFICGALVLFVVNEQEGYILAEKLEEI
jgi:UMF1 family MFS transporter